MPKELFLPVERLGVSRHVGDGAGDALQAAGHGRVLHRQAAGDDVRVAVAVQVLEVEHGAGSVLGEADAAGGVQAADVDTGPAGEGALAGVRDARHRPGAGIDVRGGGGNELDAAPRAARPRCRGPQAAVGPLPAALRRIRHVGEDVDVELGRDCGRIGAVVDGIDDLLLVAVAVDVLEVRQRQVAGGDGDGCGGAGSLAVIAELGPAAVILRQDIGGCGGIERHGHGLAAAGQRHAGAGEAGRGIGIAGVELEEHLVAGRGVEGEIGGRAGGERLFGQQHARRLGGDGEAGRLRHSHGGENRDDPQHHHHFHERNPSRTGFAVSGFRLWTPPIPCRSLDHFSFLPVLNC